jgi:hypothetical protein
MRSLLEDENDKLRDKLVFWRTTAIGFGILAFVLIWLA